MNKFCCNPFNKSGHRSKKIKVLKLTGVSKRYMNELNIQYGEEAEFICPKCKIDLSQQANALKQMQPQSESEMTIEQNVSSDSEADIPMVNMSLSPLNEAITTLGETPIKKRKLRSEKYRKEKKGKVMSAIATIFDEGSDNECSQADDVDDGKQMIEQLKRKFNLATTFPEKYLILSVLPQSWSIRKISEQFQTSFYIARRSKELVRQKGILATPTKKFGSRTLSEATVKLIQDFYCNDDNSRACPGTRDYVITREDGEKVHKQRRLLLCNLSEAYHQFKEKYPAEKVGFSKFAILRPKECVLALDRHGTHSVCVCMFHQNIKLMFFPCKKLKVFHGEIETYRDLLSKSLCAYPTENCHLSKCDNCPKIDELEQYLAEKFEQLLIQEVHFKQWIISSGRCSLETVVKQIPEFIEEFGFKLNELKAHHFISEMQSKFLKESKEKLAQNEFIVISHFAENYTFLVQDEIQAYHWANDQCTVHPFCIYFKNEDNELQTVSLVVVAESLAHNYVSVYLFQMKLFEFLRSKFDAIDKVTFFSDGAASQYKNKKNFYNLCIIEEEQNCKVEWHFFATSHGKGPCDALGGTLKRMATKASLQRPYTDQILNVQHLFSWIQSKEIAINTVLCTQKEHDAMERRIQNRYNNVKTITGTQKFHCFIPNISDMSINVKRYSSSADVLNLKLL